MLTAASAAVLAAAVVLSEFNLLPGPRIAQAAPPQLAVHAGYQGGVPGNGWAPVQVVARNGEGTPFRGYVEVVQLGSGLGGFPPGAAPAGGGDQVLARWRYPIEIPPGGVRSLAPLAPLQAGFRYEVHLVDQSGEKVASAPVGPVPAGDKDTVVAVAGGRPLPYLGALPGLRGGSVVVIETEPELLPRASGGWFSFDAVVIDGIDPLRRLEPAQLEALRLWVELGGTLVLGTGSDAAAMAQVLGPRLFPWTVRGTVETADYAEAVVLARRVDPKVPLLGPGAPAAVAAVLGGTKQGTVSSPAAGSEQGKAPSQVGGTNQKTASSPATDPEQGTAASPVTGRNRETAPGPATLPAAGTAPGRPGTGADATGTVPLAYRADVGLGRVYAWATRLDTEPWLSWPGAPAAFSAWLGSDLVPAAIRRADPFMGGQGMGGGPARAVPLSFPLAIEAAGPRGLFLGMGRATMARGGFGPAQDLLFQASRDVPGLQLPRPGMLAAGIAGYLVLIGPVTFGWLGRRRKREWAWVAVPAVAALAIVGAYLAGSVLGTVAPRNAAGYLLASPAGDRGLWYGMVSAYRPAGVPAVELRTGTLVAPFDPVLFFGVPTPQPAAGDMLRVEPAATGQTVSWPAATAGRIPAAQVHADVPLPGTLEARLQPAGGDEWQVDVVNGLSVTLHDPFIVHGNRTVARLPDLKPGDRYSDRFQSSPRPGPGQWTPPSPLLSNPGMFMGSRFSAAGWEVRQEARLQQALAHLSAGLSGSPLLIARIDGSPVFAPDDRDPAGGAGPGGGSTGGTAAAAGSGSAGGVDAGSTLAASHDDGRGPAGASDASRAAAGGAAEGRGTGRTGTAEAPAPWGSTGITLLVQPLVPEFPTPGAGPRPIRLANTLIPLEPREARASGAENQGPGGPTLVEDGMLEFEWRPPAGLLPRARALEIELPSGIGITLYDHETAGWTRLRGPTGSGLAPGAPAWARRDVRVDGSRVRVTGKSLRRFFGRDGRLALRLDVAGRVAVPFPLVVLEVDGEVSGR